MLITYFYLVFTSPFYTFYKIRGIIVLVIKIKVIYP